MSLRACRVALAALATCACLCAQSRADAQPANARVQVDGDVRQAAVFEVAPGTRLSAVALAAWPTRDAYPAGASLFRRGAVGEQVRLKAGLRHTLATLQARARADGDASFADTAARLDAWIATLPVTGRVAAVLDPRRLEIDRVANREVADGDRLHYPRRPVTVRVVGAVAAPCTLPHVPLRDAAAYLADCAGDAGADRDWLDVVQPDGDVRRIGIAAWNRGAAQALAPGAVLVVPLDARRLRDIDPDFNAELARFVATQPVDGWMP